MLDLIRRKVPIRLFSDREAWNLFRLAAFSEALGWTLLIAGIVIKHFWTVGNDTPVRIAGEVHGTIFLFYLATVVVAAGSMGWSYGKTFVAGLASVPPYGTLVLEQILARSRQAHVKTTLRQVSVRGIIISKDKLLALQPTDGIEWRLPGGVLSQGESSTHALEQMIYAQTSVKASAHRLIYIYELHRKGEQLDLYFEISGNFSKLKPGHGVDEIRFINPQDTSDLAPAFLQTVNVFKALKSKSMPTQFMSGNYHQDESFQDSLR
jgi:integral membrane protein